jgi:hypothetical protein
VRLTTYLNLVRRLKTSGGIPSLPHIPVEYKTAKFKFYESIGTDFRCRKVIFVVESVALSRLTSLHPTARYV